MRKHLPDTVDELRKFNARRKLKVSTSDNAVRAGFESLDFICRVEHSLHQHDSLRLRGRLILTDVYPRHSCGRSALLVGDLPAYEISLPRQKGRRILATERITRSLTVDGLQESSCAPCSNSSSNSISFCSLRILGCRLSCCVESSLVSNPVSFTDGCNSADRRHIARHQDA